MSDVSNHQTIAKAVVLGGLSGVIAMEVSHLLFIIIKPVVSKSIKYYATTTKSNGVGVDGVDGVDTTAVVVAKPGSTTGAATVELGTTVAVVSKEKTKRKKRKDMWIRITRLLIVIGAAYLLLAYVNRRH